MRRHLLVTTAVAGLAMLGPQVHAAPPKPQIVDPAGDANGTWAVEPFTGQRPPTGIANVAYADITSVLWQTTSVTRVVKGKKVRVVTGFTVTATVSGNLADIPPAVPIMYSTGGRTPADQADGNFGIYYLTSGASADVPQSGIWESCGPPRPGGLRHHEIARPAISASTMTWGVPLRSIPDACDLAVGSRIRELEFHVMAWPNEDNVPGFPGEANAPVMLDLAMAPKRTSYRVGS